VAVTTKLDLFGSERARLGFLVNDSVLLYGTGGLAWTQVKYNINAVIASFNPFDAYRVGWTAGAGIEYAFNPLWSAKLEYLHADFDEYNNPYFTSARTLKLTTDSVRVGVNYHGELLMTLLGI
jgi:outer membrane immunogenic protein